jgi:hypothetical protein
LTALQLLGVDFTSAPTRRKPIAVARGVLMGARLSVTTVSSVESFAEFEQLLNEPGPWLGGFDFPFGLPRELVLALRWPTQWRELMLHFASLDRATFGGQFKAFRDARPKGEKWAHRATDLVTGASPSMRDVNPPVAWMMHAGVPRLIGAGVHIPALLEGDKARIAVEAYPGCLARKLIRRRSYKSDDRKKQTHDRLLARKDLLHALEIDSGALGLRTAMSHALNGRIVEEPQGDLLDAVLCLVQAACASRMPSYGMPRDVDPLEGWIVGA